VTTLQAIFLGMMLAWTPGMVLVAYLLWRETGDQHPRSPDRDMIRSDPGLGHAQPGTRLLDF
jgi:hypothetical protein